MLIVSVDSPPSGRDCSRGSVGVTVTALHPRRVSDLVAHREQLFERLALVLEVLLEGRDDFFGRIQFLR